MELLITGGALIGAILGRFFNVMVLLPVCAVAGTFLVVKCQFGETTFLDSLAGAGFLVMGLEVGYFTGVLSTDISAALLKFGGSRIRSR